MVLRVHRQVADSVERGLATRREYSPAMTLRSAFTKWFAIGALVATILLVGQVQEVGGIAGLLQVAEGGHLQPAITDLLGDIPLADEGGHDTSLFYGIGLDPTGEWVPELIDHPAYRYRRILHPVAASAFGLLDGYPLIWGMMVVVTVSTALAAGFVAASSVRMRGSDWVALVVILNPGVWLGVRLLTAEPLALALMAAGLFFALSDAKRASLAAFVASVMTKEVFAMTPVGLGVSKDRRRWVFAILPIASLLVWVAFLQLRIGDALDGGGNLALPFAGIAQSASLWSGLDGNDIFYLGFALVSVAAGLLYGTTTKSWLRWSILLWSILAILSSHFVWDLGNNAARAFSPIAVLIGLAEVRRRLDKRSAATHTERSGSLGLVLRPSD